MQGRNKEFFSYVIPSVLAFALSGIYTIVDGFFIGQSLGDIGLAAITLGYPISALVGTVGTGIGLSGAIRYTIRKAQNEVKQTQACFTGTTLLLLAGVLFGASPESNGDVARYLPYFLATLLFLAFVRITTSYFYATEETLLSYVLVYAEPVCTLLLLLTLPLFWKLTGVWLAVPLAQVLTFGIGLVEYRVAAKRASRV